MRQKTDLEHVHSFNKGLVLVTDQLSIDRKIYSQHCIHTTQHYTTQHNTTQHNTTQRNTTQYNAALMLDHWSLIRPTHCSIFSQI